MNDLLNEKQKEAVINTEGFIRIVAGAGTGKTKVLVERYAYLVNECGIDPNNILCVTFTNKAAGEMKTRIKGLIGDGYEPPLICTYHGFCAKILRENSNKLFMTKNSQIIDNEQQRAILSEIYKKHDLKMDKANFGKILKIIALYKATHDYVPLLCSTKRKQILENVSDIYSRITEEYLQNQKAKYTLDFNDLLYYAIYLLKNHADVREELQNRLQYILVDEFQDSSKTEMELIDILSAKYKNLTIVGDPDQCIYEWRGASVDLLVNFDKEHVPTKDIVLSQNYRSTPQILQCANSLISKNLNRLEKNLYTNSLAGDQVIHVHSKNDMDEVDYIAKTIKDLVEKQNRSYSGIAILYRSSHLSRIVEKGLLEKNIPYFIYGGVGFYERMEIKDIIAYLRLVEYDDDVSFLRIIKKPSRSFGIKKIQLLQKMQIEYDEKADTQYSLIELLIKHSDYKDFKGQKIQDFIKAYKKIKELKDTISVSELVDMICTEFGYEKYLRELGDEERLDNLIEFKRMVFEFETDYDEKLTLNEFLREIALNIAEKGETKKDTVKLMTIHASKGLEFPVVFLIGLSEGIFPSSKSLETRKLAGLEEERRLCYVAITRARERLFLMESEGLSYTGISKLPSRFLTEIGEENYIIIGEISDHLKYQVNDYVSSHTPIDDADVNKLIGKTVSHPAFGIGQIVSVDIETQSCSVKFDSQPYQRNLLISYVKNLNTAA